MSDALSIGARLARLDWADFERSLDDWGWATLLSGERYSLGVIFHNAA